MNYDPMCSCATCNCEREQETNVSTGYKAIVFAGVMLMFISVLLYAPIPVVAGCALALGGTLLALSKLGK